MISKTQRNMYSASSPSSASPILTKNQLLLCRFMVTLLCVICLLFIFFYSQSTFEVYEDPSDPDDSSYTATNVHIENVQQRRRQTSKEFTVETGKPYEDVYTISFTLVGDVNLHKQNVFRVRSAFTNTVVIFDGTNHSINISNIGNTMSIVPLGSDLSMNLDNISSSPPIELISQTDPEDSDADTPQCISSVIGQGSQSYHLVDKGQLDTIECVGILQSLHLDDDYGNPDVYGHRDADQIPYGQSKGGVVIFQKDGSISQRLYGSTTSTPRTSKHIHDLASDRYGYHISSIQRSVNVDEDNVDVKDDDIKEELPDVFLFVSAELTYDTVRLGRIDVWKLSRDEDGINNSTDQFVRRSVLTIRDIIDNELFRQTIARIHAYKVDQYAWRISSTFDCFDQHVIVQCLMYQDIDYKILLDRFLCVMHINTEGHSHLVRILDHNVQVTKTSDRVFCYIKFENAEYTAHRINGIFDVSQSITIDASKVLGAFDISIDPKQSVDENDRVYLHTYSDNTITVYDLNQESAKILTQMNYTMTNRKIRLTGIAYDGYYGTMLTYIENEVVKHTFINSKVV